MPTPASRASRGARGHVVLLGAFALVEHERVRDEEVGALRERAGVSMATDDEQLEELRRRKLQELQQQAQSEQVQAGARAEAQAQRDVVMRAILEPEARERLVRVRMARPDIADALENQLMALYQQGRIQRRIDDETLRQLLARVTPKSRETTMDESVMTQL